MTTTKDQPRANKARLDNLRGCSVGHAFRNINPLPVSALTPAPAVPAFSRSPKSNASCDHSVEIRLPC